MRTPNLDHPFQPGVAVVIRYSHFGRDTWTEAKVAKAYRSGRFLLEGKDDQWSPRRMGFGGKDGWTAYNSSHKGYRESVHLLDDETRATMTESQAKQRRQERFRAVRSALDRTSHDEMTDEALDLLEAALKKRVAE